MPYLISDNLSIRRACIYQLHQLEFHSCNDGERIFRGESLWRATEGFGAKSMFQISVWIFLHWSFYYQHLLPRARSRSWILLACLPKWAAHKPWNRCVNIGWWHHHFQVWKLAWGQLNVKKICNHSTLNSYWIYACIVTLLSVAVTYLAAGWSKGVLLKRRIKLEICVVI